MSNALKVLNPQPGGGGASVFVIRAFCTGGEKKRHLPPPVGAVLDRSACPGHTGLMAEGFSALQGVGRLIDRNFPLNRGNFLLCLLFREKIPRGTAGDFFYHLLFLYALLPRTKNKCAA